MYSLVWVWVKSHIRVIGKYIYLIIVVLCFIHIIISDRKQQQQKCETRNITTAKKGNYNKTVRHLYSALHSFELKRKNATIKRDGNKKIYGLWVLFAWKNKNTPLNMIKWRVTVHVSVCINIVYCATVITELYYLFDSIFQPSTP